MVARKGKSVPAKVPRASGKNIAKYKAQKGRKAVKAYVGDDDSDSSVLSSAESSEEEEEQDDGGEEDDSEGTEDGHPELLIRPVSDDSGDSGDDDDDDDDQDDDFDSDSDSDDTVLTPARMLSRKGTPVSRKGTPVSRKGTPVSKVGGGRKSRETTPLPVPKKLDLAKIRGRSASAEPQSPSAGRHDSIATNGSAVTVSSMSTTTSSTGSGDDFVKDEEIEMVSSRPRPRRASIVEHAFDEQMTFPRSRGASAEIDTIEGIASMADGIVGRIDEDEYDEDEDEEDDKSVATAATPMSIGTVDDDEGDDFEEASLLALLEQEDDESSLEGGFSLSDGDDELDDDALEEEEEKALVEEFSKEQEQDNDSGSVDAASGAVAGRAGGQGAMVDDDKDLFSDQSSPLGLDGYEFEDGESEVSFDDDFFERHEAPRVVVSSAIPEESSSADDSYLWSYFFTSGDESDDEADAEARRQGAIVPKAGRIERDESGESTDEDLSLPPPSHRKVGARATEVLSSSTAGARPPVLGSWDLNDEQRPFGIIDGLTTRTLSPPTLYADIPNSNYYDGKMTPVPASRKRGRTSSHQHGFQSDSELSELALDDVIYTDDLDEDEAGSALDMDVTPVWNRYKNVPLSAFRNRGVHTPVYYHHMPGHGHGRRQSTSGGSGRRGSRSAKEAVMTPVRSVRKHSRKHARKKRDMAADTDIDPPGTSDLIDELLEAGAFSPLFHGI